MVLVGYDQEHHHSFRDFDDCEELRYLTLLVPLRLFVTVIHHKMNHAIQKQVLRYHLCRHRCTRPRVVENNVLGSFLLYSYLGMQ